jgi:cysteine desulfurase
MEIKIYADHAATTALSPAAYEAMLPWLQEEYGNPSTLYSLAREPRKAVASARQAIADCIGAKPDEIFFTSGGTEADNWALTGVAFRQPDFKCEIISSCIEHHAILHTCDFLKHMGYGITLLPVDKRGVVSPETLEQYIQDTTSLVSIMFANNEIGSVQPIRELAEIAHQHGCLFHTDAVQGIGHIPIDVQALGVDMLSASAHKFNGPKGIGFLYVRDGVSIESFMHGGAQEKGKRAGTENVAGIIGMAEALREHQEHMAEETEYVKRLAKTLLADLRKTDLDFLVNGSENRVPGSLSLSFRGIDGEALMHRLDFKGSEVSTGSACDSMRTILSHVLRAIAVPEEYAYGTIRVTLGMDNTTDQMHTLAEQIYDITSKMQKGGFHL